MFFFHFLQLFGMFSMKVFDIFFEILISFLLVLYLLLIIFLHLLNLFFIFLLLFLQLFTQLIVLFVGILYVGLFYFFIRLQSNLVLLVEILHFLTIDYVKFLFLKLKFLLGAKNLEF